MLGFVVQFRPYPILPALKLGHAKQIGLGAREKIAKHAIDLEFNATELIASCWCGIAKQILCGFSAANFCGTNTRCNSGSGELAFF